MTRSFLLLIAVPMLGCDDPLRPRAAPEVRSLSVFMILDPDSASQSIIVRQVSAPGIDDLLGVVEAAGASVATARGTDPHTPANAGEEYLPCTYDYGFLEPFRIPRCLNFAFTPQFGTTYDVTISARDRPTIHARTTVPGDFSIVSHSFEGVPPEAVHLRATWTQSAGSYRYLVAVQARGTSGNCMPKPDCSERWFVVTEETNLDVVVGSQYFDNVFSPFHFVVYAINQDLYDHLFTGTASDYFPVPPAQNVVGGQGSVGAWVKRSVPIN